MTLPEHDYFKMIHNCSHSMESTSALYVFCANLLLSDFWRNSKIPLYSDSVLSSRGYILKTSKVLLEFTLSCRGEGEESSHMTLIIPTTDINIIDVFTLSVHSQPFFQTHWGWGMLTHLWPVLIFCFTNSTQTISKWKRGCLLY